MKSIHRGSGVLMHISSLPDSPFNGDLGRAAYKFVDLLAAGGQSWWQTLPCNPYGKGHSPYSTVCSLAGEPLFIAIDRLVEDGLLPKSVASPERSTNTKVNYRAAEAWRCKQLKQAFLAFKKPAKQSRFQNQLRAFRRQNKYWLSDFTLFQALSQEFGSDWSRWPTKLRSRDPDAMRSARKQLANEIEFNEFLQFFFFKQWHELKDYAKARGVGLIGDIPIFVSHGSNDVWGHQKYFQLNNKGQCSHVAGVPPDYFNKDGQLWGNALYNWQALQKDHFGWWVQRLNFLTKQFDVIRLDHFIGFHRYWRIPATAKSAKSGKWHRAPGHALFDEVLRQLPKARFIAEDLGLVTPEVWKLRDDFAIPGMRVLQFGFGTKPGPSYHMPYQSPENSVFYTGTHDNDTARGWHETVKSQRNLAKPDASWSKVKLLVGEKSNQAALEMIKLALMSPACLTIVPMQDWLNLGKSSRMNIPGTPDNNWRWRATHAQLHKRGLFERMLALSEASGRYASVKS